VLLSRNAYCLRVSVRNNKINLPMSCPPCNVKLLSLALKISSVSWLSVVGSINSDVWWTDMPRLANEARPSKNPQMFLDSVIFSFVRTRIKLLDRSVTEALLCGRSSRCKSTCDCIICSSDKGIIVSSPFLRACFIAWSDKTIQRYYSWVDCL